MQRVSADLPEPDGPHTTARSPFRTDRSTSFSTQNSPNHLLTPRISMIGAFAAAAISAARFPFGIRRR